MYLHLSQGENLNLACEADEVMVMIGNETCKVNSIDLNTLYCTPPVSQPPHFGSNGILEPNALPLVKVTFEVLESMHSVCLLDFAFLTELLLQIIGK